MTRYDYAVLVFYFGYMLAISWVFRKFVTNVSDYFRGGGKALWWMVGGSAFMAAFSAWTFTGGASKAYLDGWPIMAIFVANAVGFVLSAVYFAPRFRQYMSWPTSGSHRLDGILFAAGPDIEPGTRVHGARLIDIMPTWLQLMGLPLPKDLEGRPIYTLLERRKAS